MNECSGLNECEEGRRKCVYNNGEEKKSVGGKTSTYRQK
jgi:hypothetical protein